MSTQKRKSKAWAGGIAVVALLIGAFAWTSYGQFSYSRYTSPPVHTEATIAGDKITIEYYAPSMHGRKIMGGRVHPVHGF